MDDASDIGYERALRRIRRINTRRAMAVNSASLEPPVFICEECGEEGENCECPTESK